MGLGHIKSSEYTAWARLNGIEISPTEARILKIIDREFVLHHSPPDDEEPPSEPPSLIAALKQIAQQRETSNG